MPDPIFARTRHVYDSYTDYWRLVELSDFQTCYVDEIDLQNPEKVYILSPMNGEFKAHLNWEQGKRCTIYWWNLERPGDGSVADYIEGAQQYLKTGMVDEVLVSDKQLAADTGFHFVPLGSHPELGSPGIVKTYDFVHLMCYSYRRSQTGLYNYIIPKTEFAGFSIGPNSWNGQRHNVLQSSRFMLNIHQDKHPYIEPLRLALAAAYGLPILSEVVLDPYPYRDAIFFSVSMLKEAMQDAISNYSTYKQLGERIRKRMTVDLTFRRALEAYL